LIGCKPTLEDTFDRLRERRGHRSNPRFACRSNDLARKLAITHVATRDDQEVMRDKRAHFALQPLVECNGAADARAAGRDGKERNRVQRPGLGAGDGKYGHQFFLLATSTEQPWHTARVSTPPAHDINHSFA
jgi:hypothetical protein